MCQYRDKNSYQTFCEFMEIDAYERKYEIQSDIANRIIFSLLAINAIRKRNIF